MGKRATKNLALGAETEQLAWEISNKLAVLKAECGDRLNDDATRKLNVTIAYYRFFLREIGMFYGNPPPDPFIDADPSDISGHRNDAEGQRRLF